MTATPFDLTDDGRLPAGLARTVLAVDGTVSPSERMEARDLPGYLGVGESALKAIRIAQLSARVRPPQRILDFACGHGRVLRWLRAAYPQAHITAADVLADGVDFCVETFGASGVYAAELPQPHAFPERYDLIWVGSLFTHLNPVRWVEMFGALHALLAPEGLLVVTTHGPLVAQRLRTADHYGFQPEAVTAALADYERDGFGFMLAEPNGYGLSFSRPSWVTAAVEGYRDLRLVSYMEAMWANHQDVVAFTARPIDTDWPLRPYT